MRRRCWPRPWDCCRRPAWRRSPVSGKRIRGFYEPIHGTAPDIAGQNIANPIASILSVAMMLRYSLGLTEEAAALELVVDQTLAEGYRTRDIAAPGGQAVGTTDMGSHIIGALESGR